MTPSIPSADHGAVGGQGLVRQIAPDGVSADNNKADLFVEQLTNKVLFVSIEANRGRHCS